MLANGGVMKHYWITVDKEVELGEKQHMDILFRTEEYVFSYRVAGICIQNGKVLLQKPTNDTAFAFPGGHVTFGETNAQTLVREFQEGSSN